MSETYKNIKYRSYTTEVGLSKMMYRVLLANSKSRCMCKPNFNYIEFYDWLTSSTNFRSLFSEWKDNRFDKNLRPSVDRLDNNKSYSFDNIRLVTWEENCRANYESRMDGTSKELRPVSSYTVYGDFVKSYKSIKEAIEDTGATNINSVLNGKRKTSKGLLWKRD